MCNGVAICEVANLTLGATVTIEVTAGAGGNCSVGVYVAAICDSIAGRF